MQQVDAFNGAKLQLARDFRGLTQSELAQKVVVSDGLISLYENGKKGDPPREIVEALSDALGFRPGFFYGPLNDAFKENECSFRHKRKASERIKAKIQAQGTLLCMVVDQLRGVLKFPKLNVPSFPSVSEDEIESAAEKTRKYWKLDPDGPINHVGRVLEHAGVIIVSHFEDTPHIDAFSRRGATSVIFLNRRIPSTSRLHFDIAHECAHLVIHDGVTTGDVETERAADLFASAFLMPKRAFAREFRTTMASFSWDGVFQMKRRWKVSAAAIVRRAYQLGLISALTYRQAYKQMSFKGWLKGEPLEPDFQEPELLASAINALGNKVDLSALDLCEQIGFLHSGFRDITGLSIPKPRVQAGVIEFPAKVG